MSAKDEFGTETTYITDNKWGAVTSYTVNSETAVLDKYGRLASIDGILSNTYEGKELTRIVD